MTPLPVDRTTPAGNPPLHAAPALFADDELSLISRGIFLIAVRALGSEDAAREVVQETIARTLDAVAASRLRDRASAPAFVRAIASHVIADMLRARKRTLGLSETLAESTESPLLQLVRAEEHARVRQAMATLSPADRELLTCCFFEGLSPGELAGRLGEPPERIRKRKSRAIARLREVFAQLRGHDGPHSATNGRGER